MQHQTIKTAKLKISYAAAEEESTFKWRMSEMSDELLLLARQLNINCIKTKEEKYLKYLSKHEGHNLTKTHEKQFKMALVY